MSFCVSVTRPYAVHYQLILNKDKYRLRKYRRIYAYITSGKLTVRRHNEWGTMGLNEFAVLFFLIQQPHWLSYVSFDSICVLCCAQGIYGSHIPRHQYNHLDAPEQKFFGNADKNSQQVEKWKRKCKKIFHIGKSFLHFFSFTFSLSVFFSNSPSSSFTFLSLLSPIIIFRSSLFFSLSLCVSVVSVLQPLSCCSSLLHSSQHPNILEF